MLGKWALTNHLITNFLGHSSRVHVEPTKLLLKQCCGVQFFSSTCTTSVGDGPLK